MNTHFIYNTGLLKDRTASRGNIGDCTMMLLVITLLFFFRISG